MQHRIQIEQEILIGVSVEQLFYYSKNQHHGQHQKVFLRLIILLSLAVAVVVKVAALQQAQAVLVVLVVF
jgi:hypothetical protein